MRYSIRRIGGINMNVRQEIEKTWDQHPYLRFGDHLLLHAMCVCSGYLGEDEDCDFDEVVFAVPAAWLVQTVIREYDELKNKEDVQYWLQNEYTSDDSSWIFDKAMRENQIVMLNFN